MLLPQANQQAVEDFFLTDLFFLQTALALLLPVKKNSLHLEIFNPH